MWWWKWWLRLTFSDFWAVCGRWEAFFNSGMLWNSQRELLRSIIYVECGYCILSLCSIFKLSLDFTQNTSTSYLSTKKKEMHGVSTKHTQQLNKAFTSTTFWSNPLNFITCLFYFPGASSWMLFQRNNVSGLNMVNV